MTSFRNIKRFGLIIILVFSPLLLQRVVAQPGYQVPVESFYNELAPYGQWIQHPGYGNVWLPNVGPDFQPYASAGHWIVTEYGNTWVSDYPWGWAPFHYGRWIFDQAFGGWLWIPGSEWGPAWVSWRSGGGYYGWAPLGPGWNVNVNVNIPTPYWTFVPQVYITSPNLYSYYVPRPRVVTIYQNTTIINNYYRTNNQAYVYGPPRGDIERITRQSVPVYRVDPMNRPGRSVVGNGSVGFYHPGQSGPGSSAGYRQDYGRNDRMMNSSRGPAYEPSIPQAGRGYYGGNTTPGRVYEGNTNTLNREYSGSGNGSSRVYDRPFSGDRTGNAGANPTPNAGNYTAPQSNRFESGRESYSPGYTQQAVPDNSVNGGYNQPSNRHYERFNQQSPAATSGVPMGGARTDGGYRQQSENRGQSVSQQQEQRSNGSGNPGERRQRGPR